MPCPSKARPSLFLGLVARFGQGPPSQFLPSNCDYLWMAAVLLPQSPFQPSTVRAREIWMSVPVVNRSPEQSFEVN